MDLGNFLIVGKGPRSGKMIPWDSLGKLSAESSMRLPGVLSSLWREEGFGPPSYLGLRQDIHVAWVHE